MTIFLVSRWLRHTHAPCGTSARAGKGTKSTCPPLRKAFKTALSTFQANEERNAIRTKWAEFFRAGGFDAVLMPVYPVPAIEHDQAGADDTVYPHTIYGPYVALGLPLRRCLWGGRARLANT